MRFEDLKKMLRCMSAFHQNPEAGFIPLKNLDRGPPAVAERNMQREYGSS